MAHLMQQKLPRKFKVKRLVGSVHQPGTDFVGTIKQDWHGDWVTHPDQANRQWQVDVEQDSQSGSHDHLAGEWNECHKKPDSKSARGRAAVKAPQVWIIKHIAENLQRLLALDYVMAWQETSDYLSWHCCSFYSMAWR